MTATAPAVYRCGKCGSANAHAQTIETGTKVTCKQCWHSAIILLPAVANKPVTERRIVPVEERSHCDFTIDSDNMITTPRSYYCAQGMYRRPDGTYLCAYVTADQNHCRFPANFYNLSKFLGYGVAARHASGLKGTRFKNAIAARLLELRFKRWAFQRAEGIKLNGGNIIHEIPGLPVKLKVPAAAWVDCHTVPGRSFFYQQTAAVELAVLVKRCGLWMEQRTGKTPTMMAIIKELFDMGEIDAVYVIAPVRLLHTAWADEMDRYMPGNRRIVMNSEATRLEAIKFDKNVYLSSFESAVVNWQVIKELHDPRRVCVIMDETIKIKSPTAKRALGCLAISREVDYLYELSGAPVSRKHEDIWTQAYCIDPGILGDNIDAFAYTFFGTDYTGGQVFKRHMKKEFHELQDYFQYRCTRGEAEQFTGRDTYTINVKLKADPIQAGVYKSMLESYLAVLETSEGMELENEATNILVQLLRLREILGGFFSYEVVSGVFQKVRLPGNPKADWLRSYVDEHEGTQFIVFCEFNEEEAMIGDLLDELGLTWGGMLAVDRERRNGTSGLNREELFAEHVHEFQAGDRQVYVGKHSSIGHGLTLSAADAAIFWNMGFNSDNYDQGRMRPVAGGKCALIYHLMIQGSIETEHIYPTLRGRGDMKAAVLKDARRKGYYSFFEELGESALEVAAGTDYDIDPLESEARRITGYTGELNVNSINTWLRGDSPLLARLEMVRSAGSMQNAYHRISSIYDPSRERNTGVEHAYAVHALAVQARADKWDWEVFIDKVCEKCGIDNADNKNPTNDKMFSLMVAYLRMKSDKE